MNARANTVLDVSSEDVFEKTMQLMAKAQAIMDLIRCASKSGADIKAVSTAAWAPRRCSRRPANSTAGAEITLAQQLAAATCHSRMRRAMTMKPKSEAPTFGHKQLAISVSPSEPGLEHRHD